MTKLRILSVLLHQGQHPLYSLGVLGVKSGCGSVGNAEPGGIALHTVGIQEIFVYCKMFTGAPGRSYSCALTIESSLAMTFAFWFLCQQLPTLGLNCHCKHELLHVFVNT